MLFLRTGNAYTVSNCLVNSRSVGTPRKRPALLLTVCQRTPFGIDQSHVVLSTRSIQLFEDRQHPFRG